MEFLASDIETIVKLKRNRVQDWTERGYCKPSISVGKGPGTKNKWSQTDLYTLAMFKKITGAGIARKLVSDLLAEGGFKDIDMDVLKTLRHRIFFIKDGKVSPAVVISYKKEGKGRLNIDTLAKKLQGGAFDIALVINLQAIFNEVDTAIKEWEKNR